MNWTIINFVIVHMFIFSIGSAIGYLLNDGSFAGVIAGGIITASLFFIFDRYAAYWQTGSFKSLKGYGVDRDG